MSALPSRVLPFARALAPYALHSLQRAAALASRLHSEVLSPEHWLAALLSDEECAATRVVLHAFADPETIGVEVLALCSGIMVVGSERTLPFSVLGVEALFDARGRASGREARVEPIDIYAAALARLTPELRQRLASLPGARTMEDPSPPSDSSARPASVEGPLFRSFSNEALRALGASGRAAASLARPAIGPAHLLLGALEVDPGLRERTALSPGRVRMACSGQDEDLTPLPDHPLTPEASLLEMLGALGPGAQTVDVLGWILAHGSPELRALLVRQKVTLALFERCHSTFQDPSAPPSGPEIP